MKPKIIIVSLFVTIMLSSCSTLYYQVYKATPTNAIMVKDNNLIYEDDNCTVSYNLWDEYGNMGFRFYNKTDKNIVLNLDECFFIINESANDYYKNRVFTTTSSKGTSATRSASASKSLTGINFFDLLQTSTFSAMGSVGVMNASGQSVSYIEEKLVNIPPKTAKIIEEYDINQTLYRDCDLYMQPSKRQIRTKKFTEENSPFVFSNRITYYLGNSLEPLKFENQFYISEITNYPAAEITESKNEEFCGEKGLNTVTYFTNMSPDKFYIKYAGTKTKMKH